MRFRLTEKFLQDRENAGELLPENRYQEEVQQADVWLENSTGHLLVYFEVLQFYQYLT